MTRKLLILAVAAPLLCLSLVGCRARPVSLTGTYGVATGKTIEPALRISETRTGYLFEERTVGEWQTDPETPHVASGDDVRRVLGMKRVSFPVFGLVTGKAVLLKVQPGWRSPEQGGPTGTGQPGRELVTKTGYLLTSGGETFAAQKVELGSR